MSISTISLSKELRKYLLDVSVREPDVLKRLREETMKMEYSRMQTSPEQGAFMAFLVELIGAHRTLEIGVFTGYSTLAVALALHEDGQITACDINKEWTDIARRYWEEAGVTHKIDLQIAPAIDTLDSLIADGKGESYDFAFIDADKVNYNGYFERALKLVRSGGIIAIDNVLWGGSVIDEQQQDADTRAIRSLNEKVYRDKRVTISMVPIGDGLTLACKR